MQQLSIMTCITFLYLCSLHNNIILHCNNILLHVCVLLRVPVWNKQSERALWIRPEAHFLLTGSLNNKKNIAPLTLDYRPGLSWSIAQSIFSSSKLQHANNAPEHTSFSDQHADERKWAQNIHFLFIQRGAGWENENCVGLKQQKHVRRVYDRAHHV